MSEKIFSIIEEINLENGSNYKLSVLKKYAKNTELQRVLKMTYDRVDFNYGVGKTSLGKMIYARSNKTISLDKALDILENEFAARKVTGNAALDRLQELLNDCDANTRTIVTRIIERDLKINIGKTQINKIWKDLITKPTYMRCDVYSKKTAKNIEYPALVQMKADGTYREFNVDGGHVTSRSRSGESYEYPVIFEQMKNFPDGIYTGELTVRGYTDRAKGNGLINSDNPPHDDIVVEFWDYISHEEYTLARRKDKKNTCKTTYLERWSTLNSIVVNTDNVKIIPHKIVNSLTEALQKTSEWMNQGYEGSILKCFNGVFKDGTSKQQLKLKLEISAEMRCVGFHEGSKGTKREGKVGSIIFANDEGTIKGRCSGFTDEELDYFTENQDNLIGKIMEVQFNDLSKAEGNDYYALNHPRFIEWRNDKDETDTLKKVLKYRQMAMELK